MDKKFEEVDLPELEWVEGHCVSCFFYSECEFPNNICKVISKISGKNYEGGAGYFRLKENWQPCTRENTKEGDQVRCIHGGDLRTIEAFFQYESLEGYDDVLVNNGTKTFTGCIEYYEINVSKKPCKGAK